MGSAACAVAGLDIQHPFPTPADANTLREQAWQTPGEGSGAAALSLAPQGHRRAPLSTRPLAFRRVVATPTGTAPAREPRQGAEAGASPTNEAGLHSGVPPRDPGDRICIYRYAESSTECLSPGAAPSIPAARRLRLRLGSRHSEGEHGAIGSPHSCRTAAARDLRRLGRYGRTQGQGRSLKAERRHRGGR